ncbi:hypothetical protein F5X99DRAFT_77240 [Biscogniauxia marginata]|nr:hypothetical protein F5X99DRAFT_77240 [Biscogniauxia marginata]
MTPADDCYVAELMKTSLDTSPPFHCVSDLFQRHWNKYAQKTLPYDMSLESLRKVATHIPPNHHEAHIHSGILDQLARCGYTFLPNVLWLVEAALDFDELLVHFDWQRMHSRCQMFYVRLSVHYAMRLEALKKALSTNPGAYSTAVAAQALQQVFHAMCPQGPARAYHLTSAHLIGSLSYSGDLEALYSMTADGYAEEVRVVRILEMTLPVAAGYLNPIIEREGRHEIDGAGNRNRRRGLKNED